MMQVKYSGQRRVVHGRFSDGGELEAAENVSIVTLLGDADEVFNMLGHDSHRIRGALVVQNLCSDNVGTVVEIGG